MEQQRSLFVQQYVLYHRILDETVTPRLLKFYLTLWPCSLTYKQYHIIYVKFEYFTNKKKVNIVKKKRHFVEKLRLCSKSKKNREIYLLIKCIESFLWREQECLSYIEDAWCLKVNIVLPSTPTSSNWLLSFSFSNPEDIFATCHMF